MKPQVAYKIPYLRGDKMEEGFDYHIEFREGFHGRTKPELSDWKKTTVMAEKSPSGKYFLWIQSASLELIDEFDCGEGEFSNHFSVEEHYLIIKDFSFRKN